MAIFGNSKNKRHHHSPPKYQQERPPVTPPVPISSPPQQHSYFPPQYPPTPLPYGQLTSPSAWVLTPPPYQPYSVTTISQTYFVPSQSPPQMSSAETGCPHLAKLKAGAVTVTNLLQGDVPECVLFARNFNNAHYLPVLQEYDVDQNQNASLYNLIASKLDAVVTLIDGERFSGDEKELVIFQPPTPTQEVERSAIPTGKGKSHEKSKGGAGCPITSAITHSHYNYFEKVNLYANSRLPLNLKATNLHLSTFPLLNLAAEYSERVYAKPTAAERETHVEADMRMGTKAMVIKSLPRDDMATIVVAIRGSQTFMDWAVNLKTAPSPPTNLLDDDGNLCHSGFLSVARKMIIPVAARLRHLLDELYNGQQRSKKNYSLLITGHSAGGAIASLLFSHLLSTTPETMSELRKLAPSFERIHCVTFGAPPVSLLPLMKPPGEKMKKNLFLSFVNEGDPVARADKKYVRSLLDLYSSPPPVQASHESTTELKLKPWATGPNAGSRSDINVNVISPNPKPKRGFMGRPSPPLKSSSSPPKLPVRSAPLPIWPVPVSELSNAGKIIVLRSVNQLEGQASRKLNKRMDDGIFAQTITDEQLRGVIWGDPVCHMMSMYTRRIEVWATSKVMGRS